MLKASLSILRIFFGTATVVVPVTVTFLDVFGYVAKVQGVSMQPSLNPEGQEEDDFVMLNRWAARNYDITRGEVVSLTSPTNPEHKIIKRVIGLEGDVVKTLSYKNRYVKIPEGHCWIEGDHHGSSMDSNTFGPVAVGLISAKASHIVWPPSRWQRLRLVQPKAKRLSGMDYAQQNSLFNEQEQLIEDYDM